MNRASFFKALGVGIAGLAGLRLPQFAEAAPEPEVWLTTGEQKSIYFYGGHGDWMDVQTTSSSGGITFTNTGGGLWLM